MPTSNLGGYRRRLEKKESSKGFTLVELIVVIVILAILAAILIPGLLKWINEAKEAQYKLEAKAICQAAQAEAVKLYAKGEEFELDEVNNTIYVAFSKVEGLENYEAELEKIEELSGIANITAVALTFGKDAEGKMSGEIKIADIIFTSSDRKNITITRREGMENMEWYILSIVP